MIEQPENQPQMNADDRGSENRDIPINPDQRLSAEIRGQIIAAARSLIGVPFQHQGRDESVGLDCQGFIHAVCARLGYRLSDWPNNHRRYGNDALLSYALETDFHALKWIEHAQPADVIMVELPRRRNLHVGILAEGEFGAELIHALAFGNPDTDAVKADRLSRWKVIAAFTWHSERFKSGIANLESGMSAHCSPLTAN